MNSDLVPFTFEGRQVRSVTINGEPWFVAVDVCAILELGNVAKAVKALRKDDLTKSDVIDAIGRMQRTFVINEPGLYRLILRSNKDQADRFQDWICREVLPSIRKTGQYSIAVPAVIETPKGWEQIFSDSFRRHLFRLLDVPLTATGKTPLRIGRAYWHVIYNRLGNGVAESLREVDPRVSGKPWRERQLHRHIAEGLPTDRVRIMALQAEAVMGCYSAWAAFIARWDELYPPVHPLPRGLKAQLADGRQLFFQFQ
jgi:BRO family, N-terminal domain/P63C domain